MPGFPSRTNLKLHNFSLSPKMVKKVIANLDTLKAYGPDCIPVVVLKNCDSELLYALADLFNICLKKSCFPDYWKVSKMLGKGLLLKTTLLLVFFLLLVTCKLVSNRIVYRLDKCGVFSDFQYGFRSS